MVGIDYNHPALGGGFGPGFKVAGGWDFVGTIHVLTQGWHVSLNRAPAQAMTTSVEASLSRIQILMTTAVATVLTLLVSSLRTPTTRTTSLVSEQMRSRIHISHT
jgi:hypothetical protein